jgi:hypothetical protein
MPETKRPMPEIFLVASGLTKKIRGTLISREKPGLGPGHI